MRAASPRSLPVSLIALLAIAMTLAGCGSSPVSPAVAATPTPSAPAPTTASSSSASAASGESAPPSVALDDSLLAILPPGIGGAIVQPEPDAFAQAAADPDFARNVESAAFAVVVDGEDLASGVVARLRPAVFTEALFRDWRDTYNAGACAQAGGVAGNAQADLGGRTVYIATCAGGLHVYHAYLPERGVIVSLFSLGDRRFGEQLLGDLRP